METAQLSQDSQLAEELLRFFVENLASSAKCPKSCFAACLFTCYNLIRPDIVLELSWRYQLTQFCMPYMVQTFRTFNDKLDTLYQKIQQQEQKIAEDQKQQEDAKNDAINAAAKQFVGTRLMIAGPGNTGPQMFGQNQQTGFAPQNINNMGVGRQPPQNM
eukprot:UN05541